jgi:hypothetical protein
MICKDKPEENNRLKDEVTRKENEDIKNDEAKHIKFNSLCSFSKIDKVDKVEEKKEKYDEIEQYIGTSRNITDEEIKNAPVLILEEITDKNILKGNRLTINAAGLVNGNSKAKDGVSFFGRTLKKVIIINEG